MKNQNFTFKNLFPLVLMVMMMMGTQTIYAQNPPANNFCSGAIELPMGQGSCNYTTATNVAATNTKTGSCGGFNMKDIWFKTTANNTQFTIELGNVVSNMTIVSIYEGSCDGPEVFCDFFLPNTAVTVTNLSVGEEYFIMIDAYPSQPQGTVNICVHSPGTMPLNLLSFAGEVDEAFTLLAWVSAHEENTDSIRIERSTDMDTWETIGTVAATGWSQEKVHYRWEDRNPVYGTSYYRLQTIDRDGSFEYSKTIAIVRNTKEAICFPNPVQDELNIVMPDKGTTQPLHIEIFNMQGRRVLTKTIKKHYETKIDVHSIPPGVYLLRVNNITKKFSKH